MNIRLTSQLARRAVLIAVAIVGSTVTSLAQAPPPTARYTTASKITIPDTSNPFRIDFSTREYDSSKAVTTGAKWHFVTPVAGVYHVSAGLHISNTQNAFARIVLLRNDEIAATIGAYQFDKNSFGLWPTGGTDIRLKKGDRIHVGVILHQNGNSSTLSGLREGNWIAIHFVSP